jgi:C4-dicarboxylate transporter, DctM subunit
MASLTLPLIIAAPLVLIAFGMPIFMVFLTAALLFAMFFLGVPLQAITTAIFGSLDHFSLLAVPLFILAGDIMARGGIAQRLIEFIMSIVGGVRGSLGVATIASASAFGAMSGSSVACVAAIGKLTLPSLEKHGYGRNFSVSMITATGVIDVIIPPSIPMILYAVTAQQSVTDLFLAGIVPGLIIAAALAVYVMVRARLRHTAMSEPVNWRHVGVALYRAGWAIFAPVLILGGIYGGVFTATEAAGIACIYAAVVSVLIYREITWLALWMIVLDSGVLVAQIMIIVAAAGAYSLLLTTSGFPALLVSTIENLGLPVWLLLLTINAALLLVGSVLEPPAAILVLTPLLAPLAAKAGLDPIHFGLVVTVNLAVGLFLPPFGLNLFASQALFRIPLIDLYRGVLPFLFIYLAALVLLTYVPAVTLAPLHWFLGK